MRTFGCGFSLAVLTFFRIRMSNNMDYPLPVSTTARHRCAPPLQQLRRRPPRAPVTARGELQQRLTTGSSSGGVRRLQQRRRSAGGRWSRGARRERSPARVRELHREARRRQAARGAGFRRLQAARGAGVHRWEAASSGGVRRREAATANTRVHRQESASIDWDVTVTF